MKKVEYTVVVKIPEGLSKLVVECYLRAAIKQWRKGGDPESILFNMKDTDFVIHQNKHTN